MWSMWKDLLMQSTDKHAPLKSKRVGNKKALWITDRLRCEMHKRDFFKKVFYLFKIDPKPSIRLILGLKTLIRPRASQIEG